MEEGWCELKKSHPRSLKSFPWEPLSVFVGLCQHGCNSGLRIFLDIIRNLGTRILIGVITDLGGVRKVGRTGGSALVVLQREVEGMTS